MKKLLTLCIVHQHPKVLLGMKKRGFGEGRWNGFGGKVEPGEAIEDAARRELWEEARVVARTMERVGILNFTFKEGSGPLEVHVFRVSEYGGEPEESDEMRPEWFDASQVPFHAMWADDEHWFPLFLAGKKFRGDFSFHDTHTLLEMKLDAVESL